MLSSATASPLGAAVSAALAPETKPQAIDTHVGATNGQVRSAIFLPGSVNFGEACWIPAADGREAQHVIDEIVLDRALVGQRRSVPIAFEAIKEIVQVRTAYVDGANVARANWEAANKVVTPEVAEMVSKWRDTFRLDLRRRLDCSWYGRQTPPIL